LRGYFFVPDFNACIGLSLRRTLQLHEFYSAISNIETREYAILLPFDFLKVLSQAVYK